MKKIVRKLLRFALSHIPVRGRHRLVKAIGNKLSKQKEVITINGFHIEIDHNEFFSRNVYYGIYEEHLVNFLKSHIKEGDTVFDPGTNIGYMTAICRGLVGTSGHVYSFEPSRTCYNKLQLNENLANVTLHHAALSDQTGTAAFYDTPIVVTYGYACLENVSTPKDGIRYMVPTFSVDDYCQDNRIDRIKFLKLDIEGAELQALEGSRRMLARKAIDFILVETLINKKVESLREYNNKLQQFLGSLGYSPYIIRRNGNLLPVNLSEHDFLRTDIMWKF